ncbi:acyl-CoA dehydrogenase family protein [Pseudonocardia sp. GCM10023141]|uniref:acyl-CoA dehydrogenase family protein n=1 Tax=Pseudonocardia sp. GCM10023141 TaxID=3252653 RepID=UPI00361F992C
MDATELSDMLAAVRRFVRDTVVPAEDEIEETDAIPDRIRKACKDMGLYGFAIPQRYGGIGLTAVEEVELAMELGWTSPALRSQFGTNNGIAGHVLLEGGTEEQKQEWLPRLASGEVVASFALTEPDAGSDASALSTRAVRDGDRWLLTGTKRFITNAPLADVFMVFARTGDDPGLPASRGISAFLVPAGTPGLVVAERDHKMGQAGSWTADVHLDGVSVGPDALIGGPDGLGRGFVTAMRCLAHGRLHIAALCVGMAQRLVDEQVTYAAGRRQGGRAIATHQLVQAMIADSVTETRAGRAFVREAAAGYDDGSDTTVGPSAAKYFCSEMVGRVADRAVQIHGGSGYIRGVPVERFYRDVRLFRIYEGTSQIQQLVIARGTLAAVAS